MMAQSFKTVDRNSEEKIRDRHQNVSGDHGSEITQN